MACKFQDKHCRDINKVPRKLPGKIEKKEERKKTVPTMRELITYPEQARWKPLHSKSFFNEVGEWTDLLMKMHTER